MSCYDQNYSRDIELCKESLTHLCSAKIACPEGWSWSSDAWDHMDKAENQLLELLTVLKKEGGMK